MSRRNLKVKQCNKMLKKKYDNLTRRQFIYVGKGQKRDSFTKILD